MKIDFKDVTTATTDGEKRAHQVETCDVVDAGTSILVAIPVRPDFTATTVSETVADIFQQYGLPQSLHFDRDTRFVGSASSRDFRLLSSASCSAPDLPPLPTMPERVVPDAWLTHIAGRHYRRRINRNGALQTGRQPYYIGTEYRGQAVVVAVRTQAKFLDVILNMQVLTTLSMKGLHNQIMPLDDYIALIGQEAESEYCQYLASQLRDV